MISIDQVLLLEEKVESAVKKIEQLNAENAALRSKCAELSNALNAKSEQFSSFQSDQSKIEEGILKALNRLNAVENVVLQAANSVREPSNSNSPAAVEIPVQSVRTQHEPEIQQLHNNEVLPSENEIPSQSSMGEPQIVQNPAPHEPSVQNQNPGESSSEQNITPDIGFEFGESDSSAESKTAPASSEPGQPMFDIF